MIENTENTVSNPQTHEELVIALATLRGELMVKDQQLASMRNSRDNYQAMYAKVNTFIQNSIDNGDWTDEELEEIFWEELADLLDLQLKREVEITITTYWRATVKMPRGEDISELANHISVDDPELSHPTAELIDVEVRDTTVDRY
jgi:hypothetical protein